MLTRPTKNARFPLRTVVLLAAAILAFGWYWYAIHFRLGGRPVRIQLIQQSAK